MLNWPAWNDLEVLYRKAGRTIPETIRLQLLLRADHARNLLALIEALGKDRAAGRRWLQAFPTYLRLRNLVRDAREYDRNHTGSNARRTATVVRCFNASRCPPGPFFRWTEGGVAPYTQ